MPGYRRFVAYVYEYRKGKKESNCGFIKVEVRDARCTMEVHLNIEGVTPGVECRIYGFVRKDGLIDGILLESCETGEDSIECMIETDALNMGDSGVTLGRMGGMIFTTQTGGFFGTEWDDQPIKPANFREIKAESKADNSETAASRENGGRRQIEEKSGENAASEERKPEKKEENGEMDREKSVTTEERAAERRENTDEVQMQAEEIQERDEYRAEMPSGVETPSDMGQESGSEETGEMQREQEEEAEQWEEVRTGENKEIMLQKEEESAEAVVGYPNNSDAVDIRMAREFAESQEQEAPYPEAVSRPSQPEPALRLSQSEAASRSPQPGSAPHPSQLGAASRSPQSGPASRPPQPGAASCPLQSGVVSRALQSETSSRAPQSEPASRPSQSGVVSRPSQSGAASRPPQSGPASRPPQPGRRPHRPSWEICAPFDDSDMAQCWKIHPRDFSCFSRRQRALQNNRFLQYGHYNFGHLLLCRRSNGQYILGVPGSYDQQERFMANMFGFPYFKESRMIEVPKGRGGYWYRLIDAPNIH